MWTRVGASGSSSMLLRKLLLASLLAVVTWPAVADDAAPTDLTPPERAAMKKVEKELLDLAKFAAKGNDAAAARAELQLALEVVPGAEKARKELEKLDRKEPGGAPKEGFAGKLRDRRAEAHREVALALAEAALAVKATHPDRHQRYVELLQERFPVQEALSRLGLVYFAPYLRWVSDEDAELLEKGGELHEGQRLEPGRVRQLDQQHSSWNDAWIINDGVHEVRTIMPLRVAKQVLTYVGAYRRHFLERFGPLWDLKPPAGKLPIIVTETQADLQQRLQAEARGLAPQGGVSGAAYYLMANRKLNPCFVTYEPTDVRGTTFKVERFEQLLIPLLHEVTHQLAFEYSKHDYDATRQTEHQFWAVEGIANFMGFHVWDGKRWKLTRPKTIPMGPGVIEGPFAYCVKNKASLPPLRDFMAQSPREFMTVENYHIAATVAWFLLEGQEGKYRAQFVKLLEALHKVRDTRDLFDTCFAGVDQDQLQAEWLQFVSRIDLDD